MSLEKRETFRASYRPAGRPHFHGGIMKPQIPRNEPLPLSVGLRSSLSAQRYLEVPVADRPAALGGLLRAVAAAEAPRRRTVPLTVTVARATVAVFAGLADAIAVARRRRRLFAHRVRRALAVGTIRKAVAVVVYPVVTKPGLGRCGTVQAAVAAALAGVANGVPAAEHADRSRVAGEAVGRTAAVAAGVTPGSATELLLRGPVRLAATVIAVRAILAECRLAHAVAAAASTA